MQVVKNKNRELKRYKKACYNMKTIIYDLRKKIAKEIKENELLKEEIEGDIITIENEEFEKLLNEEFPNIEVIIKEVEE